MFSEDSRKSSDVTLPATRTVRTEICAMYIEARATSKAQRMGTLDSTFLSAWRDRRPTCWMDLQQRVFLCSRSMIRPAAAAQMHADEQSERLRADSITAMVAVIE
jgi:hypothetical protein